MSATPEWNRLIRFQDVAGKVRYGEPNDDFKSATVWEGDDMLQLSRTADVVDVSEVSRRWHCEVLHYAELTTRLLGSGSVRP